MISGNLVISFKKRRELMSKKPKVSDVNAEGKDELYLDIDRIINEGLSGGSVHMREDSTNIEEARDLEQELPPNNIQS
jgi:hypothetical protein